MCVYSVVQKEKVFLKHFHQPVEMDGYLPAMWTCCIMRLACRHHCSFHSSDIAESQRRLGKRREL